VALAVVVDISHGMKVYSQMMKPLGVDYLSLVFKNLDSLLSPNIEAKMQKYNRTLEAMDVESAGFKTLSTASFELYLALKELYKFKPNLPAEVASDVQLFKKMYVWFKPLVARWIELANVKARKQICRAIEIDEKKRLSDEALYSTSAIDTVQCLFQVCKFWVSIDWPIPSAAYAFVVNLTDVICSNARHYAECMQGILNKTGYYDDEGQFDVTEQLCVTLNDIYYVETSLANVADSLNWDKVIEAIGLEKGEAGKVQTRASLFRVVASTEEDLTIRCNAIARTIGQKMAVDIHAYSLPLVRNAENISLDVSITGLMGYLCSNLSTLNSNLMAIGFKSVLLEIYHVTIGKILDIVKDEHNLAPVVCERLDKAVKEILVPFFHSQGNGLQKEEMATDQFKHLDSILSLRKKESSYLIGQYMYELAEEQEKSRVVERGTLTVQMGFIARKKSLCIKVLNCRNLPVMDNTGTV
jgi:BAI1-associated protein 3